MRLPSTLSVDLQLPSNNILQQSFEKVGWNGYVPINFFSLIANMVKCKLLSITPELTALYEVPLWDLVVSSKTNLWLENSLKIVKVIGANRDLRIIERFIVDRHEFEMQQIPFSFNYSFDINSLDSNTRQLLHITQNHEDNLEKLPEDVIHILTIASGYGQFIKTSKTNVTDYAQMTTYGDIVKVSKHNLASPLFDYKFAIKSYDISHETEVLVHSKELVLGYFVGSSIGGFTVQSIIKLLGALMLEHKTPNITIYSFYGDYYDKVTITDYQSFVDYFSTPKQLKLYPINNTKALQSMIMENKGSELVFLPNPMNDCSILPGHIGLCKINIISFTESVYNIKYASICKRTHGLFLTI